LISHDAGEFCGIGLKPSLSICVQPAASSKKNAVNINMTAFEFKDFFIQVSEKAVCLHFQRLQGDYRRRDQQGDCDHDRKEF
jgi:hypothetical protein